MQRLVIPSLSGLSAGKAESSACLLSWRSWSFAVLTPLSAFAEEVQWRHDYNAARKEAEQKNRPLVIDFFTDNCFYCKRLDASTFIDPAVVRLMNERFIPLKIDAEREDTLAKSLHIANYPTIVLAAPEGKILDTIVGYREAPQLMESLNRVLAGLGDPEWMVRDYREATKAIAASDYGRAITLLRGSCEDNKERPVQVKAKQVLQDLEKQATGRLERSKQLSDKGQTPGRGASLDPAAESLPRHACGSRGRADAQRHRFQTGSENQSTQSPCPRIADPGSRGLPNPAVPLLPGSLRSAGIQLRRSAGRG